MEVTSVRVKVLDNSDGKKLLALASVALDDEFIVHDIKLIDGKNGMFISMPSKKLGDKHVDICHPTGKELRTKIEDAVIAEYKNKKSEAGESQRKTA